jgi:transforming growth factor-beta-induced protein
MNIRIATLTLALLAVVDQGLAQSKPAAADLVDVAAHAGSFKTLLAAAKAAGLVDALRSEGPLTVFAPSDDAFAKLPAGTVEGLLEPARRDQLAAILRYHVVPGRLLAKDVLARTSLATLDGLPLAVASDAHGARIGEARIVKTDVAAKNGVIHVIDSVLMPPRTVDLVALASQAGTFKTLLAAAQAAGLAATLASDGPFTVFAPTDEAFAKLPKGTVETLLQPENRDRLTAILKHHVVAGRIDARSALGAGTATTLNGSTLEITLAKGRLTVGGATVLANDLLASNGIVHVIDAVLLPR